jgi:hypothetical protein
MHIILFGCTLFILYCTQFLLYILFCYVACDHFYNAQGVRENEITCNIKDNVNNNIIKEQNKKNTMQHNKINVYNK